MRRYLFWALCAVVGAIIGLYLGHLLNAAWQEPEVKWRTHYETVDKWRTNYETTWIIVCGENTQRVEDSEAKPFTECNLPDTGGG